MPSYEKSETMIYLGFQTLLQIIFVTAAKQPQIISGEMLKITLSRAGGHLCPWLVTMGEGLTCLRPGGASLATG